METRREAFTVADLLRAKALLDSNDVPASQGVMFDMLHCGHQVMMQANGSRRPVILTAHGEAPLEACCSAALVAKWGAH